VVVAIVLSAIPVMAQRPATHDLTQQFQTACAGLDVNELQAIEVGGIVVLRGVTADRSAAEKAGVVARSLGYARVANLIQIADVPDDARIKRTAERELAEQRGLDGTEIAVDSTNGVVRLWGKVSNELQKDMALSLVRNINGVRSVTMALSR
jgi:osmotically-inducible protein OsmY